MSRRDQKLQVLWYHNGDLEKIFAGQANICSAQESKLLLLNRTLANYATEDVKPSRQITSIRPLFSECGAVHYSTLYASRSFLINKHKHIIFERNELITRAMYHQIPLKKHYSFLRPDEMQSVYIFVLR